MCVDSMDRASTVIVGRERASRRQVVNEFVVPPSAEGAEVDGIDRTAE